MTKPKQIKIPENITINFPADALSVIENGENAYIYANGVTYRVIENKRYWNEIEEIKAQALSTQLEEIIAMVEEMKKEMKPSIRSLRFNNCPKCGQEINREWVDREVLEIGKETLSDFLNQLNQMKGENEHNPI